MEEKNTSKERQADLSEKIPYDQLVAFANQYLSQNKTLVADNEKLNNELIAMRQLIAEQQTQSIFAYLNASFKIIERMEMYEDDFVDILTQDVQKIMMKLRSVIVPEENGTAGEEVNDGEGA